MCVDLPGYGYARVNKTMKKLWSTMLPTYLEKRPQLAETCLLIDARHPIKASDQDTLRWLLSLGCPVTILLTKKDKVSESLLRQHHDLIAAFVRNTAHVKGHIVPIFSVSVKETETFKPLRAHLETLTQKKTL